VDAPPARELARRRLPTDPRRADRARSWWCAAPIVVASIAIYANSLRVPLLPADHARSRQRRSPAPAAWPADPGVAPAPANSRAADRTSGNALRSD